MVNPGFNSYEADLPNDYYHILNCICEFRPTKDFKCYRTDIPIQFSARRLTSDMWPQVLNNFYMRPIYKRPYYTIYNELSGLRNTHIEIRYGNDTLFKLEKIYVDYLKVPENIRLTQDQIELVEDTSQIIEFPDYVCYEIINELAKLILENASDPRLQSNIPINQTIAQPTQVTQNSPRR
jgi:hypothetical protein